MHKIDHLWCHKLHSYFILSSHYLNIYYIKKKGSFTKLQILNNIPWPDIVTHMAMSRIEMFTLFGDAYLSFVTWISTLLVGEPTSWIWIAICLNCLYSQVFTWQTVRYCIHYDIEDGWLIIVGLLLDFAITAIPNHWHELWAHIGALAFLFILKYFMDNFSYQQYKQTK